MPTIEEILRARKQQELLEKAKEQASSRERLLGSEDELWRWITDQFRLLPRRQRDCYVRLWDERLLSCNDRPATPRSIADYSTRLLTSAIQTKKRLLVVLPEDDEITSSMIVATCIVLHSLDRKYCPRNRLLYICHQPGMRRLLCDVHVQDLQLSSVFPQSLVSKDLATRRDCTQESTLPELVCACRPSRPGKLINDFRPDAILVDLSGHDRMPWLPQVAAAVSKNNLPAVAWANNFLAPEIDALRDAGWLVFHWSPQCGPGSTDERQALGTYLTTDWHTEIIPLIITSPAGSPGELMASAADLLFRLRGEDTRPIIRDAITLLNRALKALTRLAVPLERYEEESRYFWGLYPIRELLAGAERFVSATRTVGLPGEAEKALDQLKAAYDLYKEADPPLWTTLSRILTTLDSNERLVVSPNASLSRLFSETLARYLGLSVEDLRELGITFSWPKDLHPGAYGTCVPLIVGAPGSYDWPRLSALFGAEQIEVLMYPHEFRLLRYSVREISAKAAIDVNENLVSLASLVNKEPPHIDREVSQAMVLAAPKLIALDGQDAVETQVDQYQLLPDLDSAAEWEALLPRDCSEEMADLGVLDADGSTITDRAIRITFDGGDVIYFERDDIVQAVVNGALAERTAASVRPGDQLLVIDGQRRQSLYSVIVGRLHDHPAVRVHLNLMERWWEEIEAAYIRKWYGLGKSDWSLLQEIQNRGSRITTVQTIQNWVRCIHCPEDSEDMRRMAEALDMAFSKANYRLIHKAAQRVHVLHRNISRRLNTWLQQQLEGYGNADEVLDGIVDDDLQLTLRDFQDSVKLLGVRTVEAVGDPILRSRLGILLQGDQR